MLQRIDKHLTVVLNEAGFTYCNCILVEDDIRAIIDTGADLKSLAATDPGSIDWVINTHHHYDHIRGNYLFPRAEKKVHALDFCAMQNREEFTFYNSMDRWEELMPGQDFLAGALQMNIEEDGIMRNLKADSVIEDGQILDFGHIQCEVIHTPGHSAGHCVFWFPEQEFMFLGDICMTAAGPWYGEVCANPDDMIASINKVIAMKPHRVTTCHVNRIYEEPVERLIEYRNRIEKREDRIYQFLKGREADIHEIAEQKLIYRMHPTWFVTFWEKLMLDKHLERLLLKGMVEKSDRGQYRAI